MHNLKFTTTHSRLFEMNRSGWMTPREGEGSLILGIEDPIVHAAEMGDEGDNPITLTLDSRKLPNVPLLVLDDNGDWVERSDGINSVRKGKASSVFWPGAFPEFAVTSVDWLSSKDITRAMELADADPVVDLSSIGMTIGVHDVHQGGCPVMWKLMSDTELADGRSALNLVSVPEKHDKVAGALSMASWIAPTNSEMQRCVEEAPWLHRRPWDFGNSSANSFDELVWASARDAFAEHDTEKDWTLLLQRKVL